MKRMKKKDETYKKKRLKILNKSIEKQELIHYNKRLNREKWEEFTEKANEKFRRTVRPLYTLPATHNNSMDAKFRESFVKKRDQIIEKEKLKQNLLIQKMEDKIKQKEAVERKKEEIRHFSLLKQKELL